MSALVGGVIGCSSGVTHVYVSPSSEGGRILADLDRSAKLANRREQTLRSLVSDYEEQAGRDCGIIGSARLDPENVREGRTEIGLLRSGSMDCGSLDYKVRVLYADDHGSVIESAEILEKVAQQAPGVTSP